MNNGDKGKGVCKTHGFTENATYMRLSCGSPQGRLMVLVCDECNTIIEIPNQSVEHHAGWKKWNSLPS